VTLFTASWRALYEQRDDLTAQPVRISRGLPRYWPAAAGFPAVELLMPDGWMFGVQDPERFGRAYRRKLHIAGVEAITAALEGIASYSMPLALCCFEADPAHCHRGQFAAWWERKTGQVVPEALHATPPEPEPAQQQMDLDLSGAR
jgi:hypothetical protein